MPVGTMKPPGTLEDERRNKEEDKRFRDQKYLQGLLKENQELVKQRRGAPAKPGAPTQKPGQALSRGPQPATMPAEPIIPGGISRAFNKRVLPRSGQPGYEQWRTSLDKAMAYHEQQRLRRKGIVSPQERVATADLKFRTSPKGAEVAAKGGEAAQLVALRAQLNALQEQLAHGRKVSETKRVEGVEAGVATTEFERGRTTVATKAERGLATTEDKQAFEAEQAELGRQGRAKLAKQGAELKLDLATRKREKDQTARAKKQSDAQADLAIKEAEDALAIAEKEMGFQRTRSLTPVKEGESELVKGNRRLAEQQYELKRAEVERLRESVKGLRRKKITPQMDRVDKMAGGVAGGADTAMGGQAIPLPPDPQEWVPGTVYVNEAGITARWNGTEFEVVQDA